MQSGKAVKQQRSVWMLIVFAVAVLPLLLLFLKFQTKVESLVQPPPPPPDPVYFSVGAGILLLMAIGVTFAKVRPREGAQLQTVSQFQSSSLIALAMSEAAAILGYIAAPNGYASMMLPFVGGSLVVILLVILPAGVAYWKALEEKS